MNIGMLLDKEFYGDMRVENEVRSLAEAGFQVYVYCFTFDGNYKEDDYFGAKIINIPVSRKHTRRLRALVNTFFNYYPSYLTKLLIERIVKHKINVLHIHDLYLFEVGLLLKKMHNKLILVGDLHENYVEGLKHYKFANSFPGNVLISINKWEKKEIEWCNKFDYLITVIEEAVQRYKSLGLNENKINVVANYVNQDNFLIEKYDDHILAKFSNQFKLLYVGGFDIHRGLESIIRALPRLIKTIKNLKLILVGRGKNENDLIRLAEELNVKNYISFEGFQPAQNIPSYIFNSDICLIPHLKTIHTDNTIPHKLFHYMILEKPIVASNCNPIERIINEVESGYIYYSNNEKSFAEKVIDLYENPEARNTFGKNGKIAVENIYNWNSTSKNLIDLYSKIQMNSKVA